MSVPSPDIGLEVTPVAVQLLAEHGFQPDFGARPLRRTIRRPLSQMLLNGDIGRSRPAGAAPGGWVPHPSGGMR